MAAEVCSMNEADVLLSRLAIEQISVLTPAVGRTLTNALTPLVRFPESGSLIPMAGYEDYRQVIARGYRAIYRYFPEAHQVRIYCVMNVRRQLPPSEFLRYQSFN
jgi:plasmid stabilization system protein ParE